MRNTLFYVILIPAFATVFFTACRKESIMTYNANENIYFDYRQGANPSANIPGTVVDSLAYTFAYSDAAITQTLIPIPVTVSGSPKGTDRVYKLIVEPGSSAVQGTHYELPNLVIRAGRVRDTLFLKLKRTPELQQSKIKMVLHLQASADFDTLFGSRLLYGNTIPMLSFRLSVTDELNEGPAWSLFSPFFGPFSKKKVLLMHDIVGLPLDFWAVSTLPGDQRAVATYYAAVMSRYLKEQALAGNTIYEEDGVTPMKMAADFQ